jgi:hypothetical protein
MQRKILIRRLNNGIGRSFGVNDLGAVLRRSVEVTGTGTWRCGQWSYGIVSGGAAVNELDVKTRVNPTFTLLLNTKPE